MMRTRGSGLHDDRGSALLIVIIGCIVLFGLAMALVQATITAVRPSDRSEKSFAALAAAEAGIDDYRARLLRDNRYFLRTSDGTNPALTGFTPVPGGPSAGEFTYAIDSSRALTAGELIVSSTGRVDGVTRTVEAVLTKRSTLDYVYVSDIETTAPTLPGAYAAGQATNVSQLCTNRRWWESGQVSQSGTSPLTGTHRNSNYCRWAGIFSSERLKGRVHTNDVWYLDPTIPDIDPTSTGGASNAVFDGAISTSCPVATSTAAGCPATGRWISTGAVSSNGNGTWSSSTQYTADELFRTTANKLWNPKYDSILDIPKSNSRMKELAVERGCVFSGPTRIRFRSDGTMAVTSPSTTSTTALCGGTSLAASPSTPKSQPTVTLNIAAMKTAGFNGVIYVQRSTSGGTSAACQKKVATNVNAYPYVIPAAAEQTELFNSSYTGTKGFPSEKFGSNTGWYDCDAGDAYIQGEFKGAITLATDNDIILTGFLNDPEDANKTTPSASNYGMPPLTSDNVLGLVPTRYLYVYRPLIDTTTTSNSAATADWNWSKTKNIILNFAAVVLTECFGAQDSTRGPDSVSGGMGKIYLRGSLGQRYRCPVGLSNGSTGYGKDYQYDLRYMVEDPPPYMLELSSEPWKVQSYSETQVRRDPIAIAGLTADSASQPRSTTQVYDVLGNDLNGGLLQRVTVMAGQGTASVSAGKVQFTAPSTQGQTVIEYVVKRPDGIFSAQKLTVTIT